MNAEWGDPPSIIPFWGYVMCGLEPCIALNDQPMWVDQIGDQIVLSRPRVDWSEVDKVLDEMERGIVTKP